jgi:FMN phosphatase YigB (HAD superfamily)
MKYRTIIFDYKRTLYDPQKQDLYPGARELLAALAAQQVPLILISHGIDEARREAERLGIAAYFQEMIGADQGKTPEMFAPFITAGEEKQTVVIGDRLLGEIKIGQELGATTIWVRQGQFATEGAEAAEVSQLATYTVDNLAGVAALLLEDQGERGKF